MKSSDYYHFSSDLDDIRPGFTLKFQPNESDGAIAFCFEDSLYAPSESQIARSVFSESRAFCVVPMIRIVNDTRYELLVYHAVETTETTRTYKAFCRINLSEDIVLRYTLIRSPDLVFVEIGQPLGEESPTKPPVSLILSYESGRLVGAITDYDAIPPRRLTEVYELPKPPEVPLVLNTPVAPLPAAPVVKLTARVVAPSAPEPTPATNLAAILHASSIETDIDALLESATADELDRFNRLVRHAVAKRKALNTVTAVRNYLKDHMDCPILPVVHQYAAGLELLAMTTDTPVSVLKHSTTQLQATLDALQLNKK